MKITGKILKRLTIDKELVFPIFVRKKSEIAEDDN